jgi:hypothetical protein
MEEWKTIPDYEDYYSISSLGNVKSIYTDRMLKPSFDKFGYARFSATKNKKQKTLRIHRLVALLFIPNPDNLPQVNHKDGDKSNNAKTNLEWSSDSENKKHAYANKLMTPGNQYSLRKRQDLPRYRLKNNTSI